MVFKGFQETKKSIVCGKSVEQRLVHYQLLKLNSSKGNLIDSIVLNNGEAGGINVVESMFWWNRTTSMPKSVLSYDVDRDLTSVWYSVFTQSCFPIIRLIYTGELNSLFHLMSAIFTVASV